MFRARPLAALAAALVSAAPIQAQPGQAVSPAHSRRPAPIPPGAQPDPFELEAAIRAHYVVLAAHPLACRKGSVCLKPPKAIRVRNYDCQARGADSKGGDLLYCRVTYVHKGGSFDTVKSPNECIPLRAYEATTIDDGGNALAWEFAMVDSEGRCPGGRE
ncbi:MAG: hypothetical protein ABWX67_00170 [Allosphingosinicella sp.]